MTNETKMTEVDSLLVARRKLASVIEIYAPLNVSRPRTLQALGAMLVEFEAAIREDERAVVAREAVAFADAVALEAKNTAAPKFDALLTEASGDSAPSDATAQASPPPPTEAVQPVTPSPAPTLADMGKKRKK